VNVGNTVGLKVNENDLMMLYFSKLLWIKDVVPFYVLNQTSSLKPSGRITFKRAKTFMISISLNSKLQISKHGQSGNNEIVKIFGRIIELRHKFTG
jgi:hypothetical protein